MSKNILYVILLFILSSFNSSSYPQVFEKNGIFFRNHQLNPDTFQTNKTNQVEILKSFSQEETEDTIEPPFIKSDFMVNSLDGDFGSDQNSVCAAIDDSGNYALTWIDYRNGLEEIFAQFYNSNDEKVGNNFKVNEDNLQGNNSPFIACNKNGDFVIVWLRNFSDVMAQRYTNDGQKVGSNIELNLSVGAGYIHNRINFETFSGSESYDSYNSYGLGVSIDYYVTLALGITFKNIHSELGESPFGEIQKRSLDANAIDYGFLLILPVTDLFDNTIKLSDNSKLIPEFNYSLGYSRLNIGDEVYYIDPAQKDPMPLSARLGHTISLGCNYESDDISINLIDYDLILEADDILISREMRAGVDELNREISYQGMLGDIDFGKHLIQLKGDDNVVVHKGNSISLVETITILNGSFVGRGYSRGVKTYGLIMSSSGLFKWLGFMSENNTIQFIANHIELKYINSTIFDGELIETDLSGFSVSFINYSFN